MNDKATSSALIEPAKFGSVDVEAFSKNLARMVENGGKALSAYLKPREEGKADMDDAAPHQARERSAHTADQP